MLGGVGGGAAPLRQQQGGGVQESKHAGRQGKAQACCEAIVCVCVGHVTHLVLLLLLLQEADLPAYARKKGRFHKGSCVGLRAWVIARLVEVRA